MFNFTLIFLSILNLFLIIINSILYVNYFKKYYFKHFVKYERKFYNNCKMLLDYYSTQKVIPTKKKKELTIEQKSWNKYQPTLGHEVVILNFNSNLNVGNIYRSCCCLGVKKYHIFGKKKYLPSSQVGYNFIPIEYHDIFPQFRDRNNKTTLTNFNYNILDTFLLKKNYNIYLVEQGGIKITDIKFYINSKKQTDLIIFGNETFGIPDNFQKYLINNYYAKVISIPQIGIGKSLNVSNCAGMILYEYQRQYLVKY